MAISVRCQACQAGFAVRDELDGKRIRCVKCGEVVSVSRSAGAASKSVGTSATADVSTTDVAGSVAGTTVSRSEKSPASSSAPAARPVSVPKSGVPSGTQADAPVVRKARRIADDAPAGEVVEVVAADDVRDSKRRGPVTKARTVSGPRDMQKESVRHTAATLSEPPEEFGALRKKVHASFTAEEIEPVPVSARYRLSILVVSVMMCLLPLLYLGMIVGVGWLTWYHAVNHAGMMESAGRSTSGRNSGRAVVFAFLLYVAPILAGITLIVFMFKPLFSRPATDSGRRTLNPEEEPLLFEFVYRICDTVGARRPSRIDIDCNINASASFGGGLLSLFGNDLVLTLGMPIVAGLTMRQFAGVLAHEFGHFAQGVGMRLSWGIRSISYWFTRVVYERDAWDEKLEEWSHSLDIRIGWVIYLVRLCVWINRRVLWCLMMLGHLVSGFLMRQMEFDADRYEARVAGSKIFATTSRQMQVLGVAHRGALADLGTFYSEGRLGDNLPKLILLNVDQLPEKIHAKIDELILESKTGLFDTHPADRERMASAAKEETEGIFRLRLPAAHLFRRFDYLSRAVTWDFYKEVFGKELKKSDIHPVDELMARLKLQQDSWKALRRFFRGHLVWYRQFQSPSAARVPVRYPEQVLKKLTYSRERLLERAERYAEVWKRYDDCDTRMIEIGLAEILHRAGIRVRKADFSIPLTNMAEVATARDATDVEQGQLLPKLSPFEDSAADRLYSALQLATLPDVSARLSEQGVGDGELNMLLDLFQSMNDRIEELLVIRDGQIALGRLLTLLSENRQNEKLIEQIRIRMAELADHISHLRDSFATVRYPFDHAKQDMTVGAYFLKALPDAENPIALYEAASEIGNALPPLQGRVFGRLCQIAEMVETHYGLPMLEDPPEEEPGEGDQNEDDEEEGLFG